MRMIEFLKQTRLANSRLPDDGDHSRARRGPVPVPVKLLDSVACPTNALARAAPRLADRERAAPAPAELIHFDRLAYALRLTGPRLD